MAIPTFFIIFSCCAQTQAILNDQITKILFSGLYAAGPDTLFPDREKRHTS
jgi:hypothetical protein